MKTKKWIIQTSLEGIIAIKAEGSISNPEFLNDLKNGIKELKDYSIREH